MERANARDSGLGLLELGELEKAVQEASPPKKQLSDEAVAPRPAFPSASLEDGPADFGLLRPYQDNVGMGEPARKGIPRTGMFTAAVAAAEKHTVPALQAIEPGKLPKGFESRPLAAWMLEAPRQFWANAITGIAGVGDCFNRLTQTALVASDVRFSAPVAERAAVRYDAAKLNEVAEDALKARGGEEVRALYRRACQNFDQTLADRCLEEEKAASCGSLSGTAPTARQARPSLDAASANSAWCGSLLPVGRWQVPAGGQLHKSSRVPLLWKQV